MSTLHITRGLPASGKSTWARSWVAQEPGRRVRVNRDDTRIFLGLKHGDNEPFVTVIQQAAIVAGLKAGKDVVVDDTNLVSKFAKELLKLAKANGAEVEWHDEFLDVPVQTCIQRDITRGAKGEARVGQDVIMNMWERQLKNGKPKPPQLNADALGVHAPYSGTPGKPDVFLVDIDGTIASNGPLDRSAPHRSFYAWPQVGGDSPIEAIIEIVQRLQDGGLQPLYVSGRDAVCFPETEEWIVKHVDGLNEIKLFMRPQGDQRKDSIVKLEIFDRHIRDNYNVKFCLDDRDQVVAAYRSIGLTVLQVAEGNF